MRREFGFSLCATSGMLKQHFVHRKSAIRFLGKVSIVALLFFLTVTFFLTPTETQRIDGNDNEPVKLLRLSEPLNSLPWLSSPELPRAMTSGEHNKVIELIRELSDLFTEAKITHCNVFGTLIGSYMFHDLLPWDDDADMWIKYDDLPKVKRLFANATLRKIYGLHTWKDIWIGASEFDLDTLQAFPTNARDDEYFHLSATNHRKDINFLWHRFKFFRLDSQRAGWHKWNWPFIDVMLYRENDTHVWNHEPPSAARICLPKTSFYPLIKRPLGHIWLNAPRDTGLFLRTRYKSFHCSAQDYRHRTESLRWFWDRPSVDCKRLLPYYPVVVPEKMGHPANIVTEHLYLNSNKIQTVQIVNAIESVPSGRPYGF